MRHQLIVLGVPAALGGWRPDLELAIVGMTRTPADLREHGLLSRLSKANAGLAIHDRGDLTFDPAFRADDDGRAKNRDLMVDMLDRTRERVADELRTSTDDTRILVLGGECTIHPATIGGIKAARPGVRLALVWFDAHGDFHTPDTTPSGNVWGMPFAIACGRGDAAMIEACGGTGIAEGAAALVGGQAREANEAWAMTTAGVAHFGSGMMRAAAGRAAFDALADGHCARCGRFLHRIRLRRARRLGQLGRHIAGAWRAFARDRPRCRVSGRGRRAGPGLWCQHDQHGAGRRPADHRSCR